MKKLFRGLAAVCSVFLILISCGFGVMCQHSGAVNSFLGISTGQIVNPDGENGDLLYYKSSYGDGTFSQKNLSMLIEDCYKQNVAEAEEGSVLLKNNGALPLADDCRKVSIFGKQVDSAADVGSGEYSLSLRQALVEGGFEVDADDSTVALVMLTRSAGEGNELSMENKDGASSLALQGDEKDLLKQIKQEERFEKIIVLLNSSNPMEVAWASDGEFAVDALLWIGGPGQRGMQGVVNIITGKANPSGRLTDTYAVSSLSAPSCVNGSKNISRWTNVDYLRDKSSEVASSIVYHNVQTESIYVGYKYYETRYEDCVLNRYGATSSVGSSFGGEWKYSNEVTYPFGFGLSYTSFEQTLNSVVDNGSSFTVSVSVKNVGEIVGKDVVQVYAQTPYGEYEQANLVEKSAVQLVAFGKTPALQPQQECTIDIEVDKYLLASYDYVGAKGYILSEGDYYLAIGLDCHDALNNIMAAKGVVGMSDIYGNPTAGNAEKVYDWTLDDIDTSTYRTTDYGEVTNKFDDCDINYWLPNSVKYLSRSDWQGTYPTKQENLAITDEMIEVLNGETYVKPTDSPSYESFEQGKNNGITAFQMRGVALSDDKWNKFVDQLTLKELASVIAGEFSKPQIAAVVLPQYVSADGIDCLSKKYVGDEKGRSCCRFANQIVLSSTWNTELIVNRGKLMGEEMLFSGVFQIYAPGADLHRTPFGGRNKEYCSEDANLTYLVTADLVSGFRRKGVGVQIKHLAGNDQEYNRSGLCLFFNEQAWREGSLRGFEGAIVKGGANGCMNGLNRVGLRWTNSSEALCTGVLRGEWGFDGVIGTDGIGSKYQTHFVTSLAAGTDSYCLDGKGSSSAAIEKYITESKDGNMLYILRESVKRNLYRLVNSSVMNGLSGNSVISEVVPWWKTVSVSAIVVLSVSLAAFIALYVRCLVADVKNREAKQ